MAPQVTRWPGLHAPEDWADPVLSAAELARLLAVGYGLWRAGPAHVVARVRGAEVADILSIYTPPAARRQGLGAVLMQALLAEAKAAGALGLTLEVRADNTAARNLYQRVGLTAQATRRGYYADGTDACVYSLQFA